MSQLENFFLLSSSQHNNSNNRVLLWLTTVFVSALRAGPASVLDEPVDVMLGPVFRRRHLEDERDAEEGLLCGAIRYHLKDETGSWE